MNKETINAIVFFGSLAISIIKFVSEALENRTQS